MKPTATHKHVKIGRLIYGVDRRESDQRYWDCGSSWGPTPEAAARTEHRHFHSGAKTVAEMHKKEDFWNL